MRSRTCKSITRKAKDYLRHETMISFHLLSEKNNNNLGYYINVDVYTETALMPVFSMRIVVGVSGLFCIVSGVTRQLKKGCIRVYKCLKHNISVLYAAPLARKGRSSKTRYLLYKY